MYQTQPQNTLNPVGNTQANLHYENTFNNMFYEPLFLYQQQDYMQMITPINSLQFISNTPFFFSPDYLINPQEIFIKVVVIFVKNPFLLLNKIDIR